MRYWASRPFARAARKARLAPRAASLNAGMEILTDEKLSFGTTTLLSSRRRVAMGKVRQLIDVEKLHLVAVR